MKPLATAGKDPKMHIIVQTFSNSCKTLETVVYLCPRSFEILARVNGTEKRVIDRVEFDPESPADIACAHRLALAKAEILLGGVASYLGIL